MKNEKTMKIIKIILMVLAVILLGFLIYYFVTGILKSLFENDVKTNQNRINSAYQFLKMLIAGILLLIDLRFVYQIKTRVLPVKIAQFLGFRDEKNS